MKRHALLLMLFSLLNACANVADSTHDSTYVPKFKTIQIVSEPAGAHIEINNNYVGDTPLVTQIRIDSYNLPATDLTITALPELAADNSPKPNISVFGTDYRNASSL